MNYRICQKYERIYNFEDYIITVVKPVRTLSMNIRKEVPDNSNKYFGE